MRLKIAGHEWVDQAIDSLCVNLSNSNPCKMTRAALFEATTDDVGKIGFAHTLALSNAEYNEIDAARVEYRAHCDKLMAALAAVCG